MTHQRKRDECTFVPFLNHIRSFFLRSSLFIRSCFWGIVFKRSPGSWDKVNSRNEEQKLAPGQNGWAGGRRADGQGAEQAAKRAKGRLGDWTAAS